VEFLIYIIVRNNDASQLKSAYVSSVADHCTISPLRLTYSNTSSDCQEFSSTSQIVSKFCWTTQLLNTTDRLWA